MSSIDRDLTYDDPADVLRFVLERWTREQLHTAMPGLVRSYDAATRRAQVLPAVQLLMTDGQLVSRPVLLDVPVLWPSGGGFSLVFPLKAEDPVMLLFSMRGISHFKAAWQEGPPSGQRVMSIRDAVCLPGFGPQADMTVAEGAVSLQDGDSTHAIQLHADHITLQVPTGAKVYIGADEEGEQLLNANLLTQFNTLVDRFNAHTHPVPGGTSGLPSVRANRASTTESAVHLTQKLRAQ